MRLRRDEWPAPIAGRLQMIEMQAQFSSFKRSTQMAQLIQMTGSIPVPIIVLADPVMTHVLDDGFVLRGIQLQADGERTYEHIQAWRVTLALAGTAARGAAPGA